MSRKKKSIVTSRALDQSHFGIYLSYLIYFCNFGIFPKVIGIVNSC